MPAAAQEASDAVQLEEIVVTATRRSEGVQDIPLNISAVTGADIDRQGLEDLGDLTQVVPGLHLVDQGGRDTNLIVVRGLNVNSLSSSEGVGLNGGGTVSIYVNDIPLYVDVELLDIERVEVLLGPQGTLYGAGTLAGAIRYILAAPDPGERFVEVGGGVLGLSHSDDIGGEAKFITNLPLGTRTAARLSVGYRDIPGFIDYGYLVRDPGVSDPEPDLSDGDAVDANLYGVDDANDYQVTTARGALLHEFDYVTATIAHLYQKQESGGRTVNSEEAFGTGQYESGLRFLEPNEREFNLTTLEVDADLGFATLTYAGGFSSYEDRGQRDQTDLLLDFEYGYEDFPSFAAYTLEVTDQDRDNHELRLVSTGDQRYNWIVGAFYNKAETVATSSEFVPGIPEYWGIDRPDNLEYYSLVDDEFTEQAVFGEFGFDITQRWSVTAGARWFEFQDEQEQGFALPLIDGSAPDEILLDLQPVSVEDDDTIVKLNTAFDITDDVLAYVTYSEGYRVGGSNAVPACETPLPPGQNVCALPEEQLILPDKTANHEFGLRTTWLDGKLTANGALFYVEWDDVQVAGSTVNGNVPITVNAAEAVSQGVELALSYQLGDFWRLGANYTYTNAELSADAPGLVRGEDTEDGDRLPGSPEHMGNISLAYLRPLGNGLTLNANYRIAAQSDVYTTVGAHGAGGTESTILGGYATHFVSLGVAADNWSVRAYARNLLDKYAETGVRGDRSYIRSIEGGDTDNGDGFKLRTYYQSVLEPLRVGVEFDYRFWL